MPAKKWSDLFYLESFRLAQAGLSNNAIASRLGVGQATFTEWVQKKAALKRALEEARSRDGRGINRFKRAVYDRMSPACQALWDELTSRDGDRIAQAKAALADGGSKVRQQLFLLALAESGWSAASARAAVGVGPAEFEVWCRRPKFLSMLAEIEEAKKDFFEGALIDLVAQGEPQAVIHANKTKNRDRGYGERVEHEHTHTLRTEAVGEALRRLPPEKKRLLLSLLEEGGLDPIKKQPALIRSRQDTNGQVIDAEIVS
jgi:AcrR family transcriptional regulator